MAAKRPRTTYLVPAFTGLGAPYWDSKAKAVVSGITRTTGKAELVRAALDCIVYQISDVVNAMAEDSGIKVDELRVDGGPTKNGYLMQFQSDILDIPVQVPDAEELSAMGPAYAAGIAMGIYEQTALFESLNRTRFTPEMDAETRCTKYTGWKESVGLVLTKQYRGIPNTMLNSQQSKQKNTRLFNKIVLISQRNWSTLVLSQNILEICAEGLTASVLSSIYFSK